MKLFNVCANKLSLSLSLSCGKIDSAFKLLECKQVSECKFPVSSGAGTGAGVIFLGKSAGVKKSDSDDLCQPSLSRTPTTWRKKRCSVSRHIPGLGTNVVFPVVGTDVLRLGVLPRIEVVCEECCRCMQKCWFSQRQPTRQPSRCMSTDLTPD